MVAAVRFAEVAAVFLNGILEVLLHGTCGNAESFGDFGVCHALDAAHIENVAGALGEVVREVEDGTDVEGRSSLSEPMAMSSSNPESLSSSKSAAAMISRADRGISSSLTAEFSSLLRLRMLWHRFLTALKR